MKIGIIGSSQEEIMPFIKEISNKRISTKAKLEFFQGNYENLNVVALFSGVCKVNAAIATQILIDDFNVDYIFMVGVAGGIDRELKVGDTVISTQIAHHDVADEILTEYHPWMKSIYFEADKNLLEIAKKANLQEKFKNKVVFGKIVTGEKFITSDGREEIISKHDPYCVDMETASVAHVCYANDIPFLAIRTISDTEEECGVDNFEKNNESSSMKSINVLKKILLEMSNNN
jgi:adenosylhomocysteine nucleosidase